MGKAQKKGVWGGLKKELKLRRGGIDELQLSLNWMPKHLKFWMLPTSPTVINAWITTLDGCLSHVLFHTPSYMILISFFFFMLRKRIELSVSTRYLSSSSITEIFILITLRQKKASLNCI